MYSKIVYFFKTYDLEIISLKIIFTESNLSCFTRSIHPIRRINESITRLNSGGPTHKIVAISKESNSSSSENSSNMLMNAQNVHDNKPTTTTSESNNSEDVPNKVLGAGYRP